jgi:hypothetical protein
MFQHFLYLTLFIGVIPLVLYWRHRKKLNVETYYFLPFTILLAVSSLYESIGTLLLKVNVTYWFWFYLLLEFSALSFFFLKLSTNRTLTWLSTGLFGLLYITLSLFHNNSNALILEGYLSTFSFITFFSFIVIWFRNAFADLSYPNLLENGLFYFFVGIMVYFAGTIFLFLLSDVIYSSHKQSFQAFWMLNVLFSFIFRILIIVGVWKSRTK